MEDVIRDYVPRPRYMHEAEPHGLPDPHYSMAQFTPKDGITELAIKVMTAYNRKCAETFKKRSARKVDWADAYERATGKKIPA